MTAICDTTDSVSKLGKCHEETVPGIAGSDLVVRRQMDELEIHALYNGLALLDTNGADKLRQVLSVLAAEARLLGQSKKPGAPAIVSCRRCGEKVFTEQYDPRQAYWCLNQEKRECYLDHLDRVR